MIYEGGSIYHMGVKNMHWYQHLPHVLAKLKRAGKSVGNKNTVKTFSDLAKTSSENASQIKAIWDASKDVVEPKVDVKAISDFCYQFMKDLYKK